ncbi:MAG: TetR/AcrR family transcriptional regulator [Paracoccaceae bacterium]
MQEKHEAIPNADRRAAMKARLIAAARQIFLDKGYAETSTPEIVKAAEVTRGALYHHYKDKEDLFRAVVTAEAAALAQAIDTAADPDENPLAQGSAAYFEAMAAPGRARLLLVDGPAVLGWDEMDAIDAGGGRASLRVGLSHAAPDLDPAELEALAITLSAAYDRAALAIAEGAKAAPYITVLERLVVSAGEENR